MLGRSEVQMSDLVLSSRFQNDLFALFVLYLQSFHLFRLNTVIIFEEVDGLDSESGADRSKNFDF